MTINYLQAIGQFELITGEYLKGYVSFETLLGYATCLLNLGVIDRDDLVDFIGAIDAERR